MGQILNVVALGTLKLFRSIFKQYFTASFDWFVQLMLISEIMRLISDAAALYKRIAVKCFKKILSLKNF